ncbi:Ribosome biogenesis protein ERB Nucleolus [Gracilaria domingensis]|nr:Ribosome biogenesis protein ERB Nucleolus [Gracilaria domingensis]
MPPKRRKKAPSPQSESPVVSDDDGLDIGFSPSSKQTAIEVEVEHLDDEDSKGSADEVERGEESDSSSDGDVNPVGDIPMRWYEGYDHIGYDKSGEKIVPGNKPTALDLAADPSSWRKIYDEKNDQVIELTHQELKEISRMRVGRYPSGKEEEEDEIVHWSGAIMKHPLTSAPEPKRRFLPSRHEARLVVKLVRAMRAGKIRRPSEMTQDADYEENMYQYDVWENHEPKTREEMTKSERARDIMKVSAPKPPLPSHAESYNPPEEYLPDEKEAEEWKDLDPEERATSYLPEKHSALRHVPLYQNFIKERFERCLDLYLAVRMRKDQRKMDPEDLVPKLPTPRELRPFPTDIVNTFGPLPSRARSISVHPEGHWLLSGSDDGRVRLWEIETGYQQCTWDLGAYVDKIEGSVPPVSAVEWCPRKGAFVFAVSIGFSLIVVSAASAMGLSEEETISIIQDVKLKPDEKAIEKMEDIGVSWSERNLEKDELGSDEKNSTKLALAHEHTSNPEANEHGLISHDEENSPMVLIKHSKPLKNMAWHRKGDYLACVGRDGSGGIVNIHRLSQRSSQAPFKKRSALVQAVKFHPTRPFFIVATMHHVRVYNLAVQQLVKTLRPGVSWISSIDVHPSGDHILVTSYDKRVCWFDLDLSTRPYKTIRNHDKAVRIARYHPRLPLFADGADDGSSHVFHDTVYDDLTKDALIVPVKRLERCSTVVDSLGVLDIAWHPRLPWLFTSGADATIHMITDCSQG